MADKFRLDFFNASKSLHCYLASLLSIGTNSRSVVTLTGRVEHPQGGHLPESISIGLKVHSLGAEDGSGNCWLFTGYLEEGHRPVKGFINLKDGNGFVESV